MRQSLFTRTGERAIRKLSYQRSRYDTGWISGAGIGGEDLGV